MTDNLNSNDVDEELTSTQAPDLSYPGQLGWQRLTIRDLLALATIVALSLAIWTARSTIALQDQELVALKHRSRVMLFMNDPEKTVYSHQSGIALTGELILCDQDAVEPIQGTASLLDPESGQVVISSPISFSTPARSASPSRFFIANLELANKKAGIYAVRVDVAGAESPIATTTGAVRIVNLTAKGSSRPAQ